ncbi:MAG: hypothetical protein HUJ29_07880, partial [Gammaproteobacteria bacterium]|nr:hypothetical protein [Gammaproteobacteria bacterium]
PRMEAGSTAGTELTGAIDEELTPLEEMKLGLLKAVLERLTGVEIKVLSMREFKEKLAELQQPGPEVDWHRQDRRREGPPLGEFAMAYDYSRTRVESETTEVEMTGQVKTADGKTLDIGIRIRLSRQLVEHEEVHLRSGDQRLFDPLVINFEGNSAELTARDFQFDLDVDGQLDRIAMLKPGSGFLALDRNDDGEINDGSELFGPRSGDGYDELSVYDEDGNDFIDEGDAIFDALRIWSLDGDGEPRLMGLGDAGIGAIYLGHIGSEFTLEDDQANHTGQLRDSGFYINEDGSVGTLQQIDLVV